MGFSEDWRALLDELDDLPDGAVLLAPLSSERFRIDDVRQRRVVISFEDSDEDRSLRRERFETLWKRVTDERDGFELDRLPLNAEHYASVLTVHPKLRVDEDEWRIERSESESTSPLVEFPAEETPPGPRAHDAEPTIRELVDNMGDPPERVTCPIDGCDYSHRSAASVARHVSGSSTEKHVWEHTKYAGWRDFVRTHE